MAIDYWHDMSILFDGLELAAHGKNVILETTVSPLDTTGLATTGWVSVIGGNKSAKIDMTLMQDVTAGSVDDALFDVLGQADVPHSICTPSADGSLAYLFRGIPLTYTPIEGAPGELAMARLSGNSSTGGVVRGLMLHPGSASRSSSSTGTGRQLGAVTSDKRLYAALHVLSVAGSSTPTLTVKVQSDDNAGFTSATDRITFTGATAVGSQWSSVAGAITDDYWRVSYTLSGSSPVFAFAVTAGIL